MRRPPLTAEAIYAAIAVLGLSAGGAACTRGDKSSPPINPDTARPPAASATATAGPSDEPAKKDDALKTSAAPAPSTGAVDAGVEQKLRPGGAKRPGGSATCAASGGGDGKGH